MTIEKEGSKYYLYCDIVVMRDYIDTFAAKKISNNLCRPTLEL
jgi:hypothetical protein